MREDRLKHVADIRVSNVDKKSAEGDAQIRLCNYTDVYYNERITSALEFMAATATRDQRAVFGLRSGDVVLTKDSETPDDIGISALVAEQVPELVCGYHLAIVRARPDRAVGGYLRWVLASTVARQRMSAAATGVTRFGLRSEAIADLPVPVPGIATQHAIAAYLDRETARIDALISAKRRMVELLQERWMALRCDLTGVADPDGPSRRVQLRRIARLQAGAAFPHDRQGDAEGTIPYVKVGDLSTVDEHDQLRGASNRVTPQIASALRSPVLPAGTIVLPKIGAALLTNRRAILSEPSCLDQNVMGVTVGTGNPRFVYYCLASIDLGDLSTPGPVPLLNEDVALSVQIPWPSEDEQKKVVCILDDHRATLLALTARLASQSDLLRERRQALITAAASGQLAIPEAA